jgi:hypothetical protein
MSGYDVKDYLEKLWLSVTAVIATARRSRGGKQSRTASLRASEASVAISNLAAEIATCLAGTRDAARIASSCCPPPAALRSRSSQWPLNQDFPGQTRTRKRLVCVMRRFLQ